MRFSTPFITVAMAVALCMLQGATASGAEEKGVCAGCPMEQDSNEYARLGQETYDSLKSVNRNLLKGNYLSISNVKTQVVAGTFFTFRIKSTLDEVIDVKLFQSLPDAERRVQYEVSFASMESSPVHSASSGDAGSATDLVIAPPSDNEESSAVSLETRGASWTKDVKDDGVY